MDFDAVIINRQTYSLLDWLGDIGGLQGTLATICYYLVTPFSTFALQRFLLTSFFQT